MRMILSVFLAVLATGCGMMLPVLSQDDLDASLNRAAAKYGWTPEEKAEYRALVEANTWNEEEAAKQVGAIAKKVGEVTATVVTPLAGPLAGVGLGELGAYLTTVLLGGAVVGKTGQVVYKKAVNSPPGKLWGPVNGGKPNGT